MLYLSQLLLNPRSPQVRGDLADCRALHSRVLHAFPDSSDITAAREHFGVLYRLERFHGGARVLVQSRERPDWSRLPADYLRMPASDPKRLDHLYAHITSGQELRFRLRANPTKRIPERATGLRSPRFAGKRIEVRGETEQLRWLAGKAASAGFVLLHAHVLPKDVLGPSDRRGPIAPATDVRTSDTAAKVVRYLPTRKIDLAFGSVVFEGRLRVTDPAAFRAALESGIGSGKAFGFGLLSIAPASEA